MRSEPIVDELVVGELTASRGRVPVLFDVSCSVPPAAIVSVIGANGAGKSTFLRVLTGVDPATGGSVRWGGGDITGWPTWKRVQAGIVHVPEGRRVFATMTVMENVEVGAIVARRAVDRDIRRRIFDLFPVLEQRQDQLAGTLSGGEQQMLAIARALVARPQVLLIDEPSLGLAPIAIGRVGDALRALREQGLGILVTEQNVNLALTVSDSTYVMSRGVLEPAPDDLVSEERASAEVIFGLAGD